MATLISDLASALSSSSAAALRNRSRGIQDQVTPAELRAVAMLLAVNGEVVRASTAGLMPIGGGLGWDHLREVAEFDVALVRRATGLLKARESNV